MGDRRALLYLDSVQASGAYSQVRYQSDVGSSCGKNVFFNCACRGHHTSAVGFNTVMNSTTKGKDETVVPERESA